MINFTKYKENKSFVVKKEASLTLLPVQKKDKIVGLGRIGAK